MTTHRLKAKIDAAVAELTSLRDRLRTNATEAEKAQAELISTRAERTAAEAERGKIEAASATELHRLSLTPAQAVVKSDALAKKAAAALSMEQEAEAKAASLTEAKASDFSRIRSLVNPLIGNARLLSQAQLMALLCSVVDSSQMDVMWTFEREPSNFFRSTFVHSIHTQREQSLKQYERHGNAEDLLRLVDEILSEPIPTLARAEAKLPEKSSSNLMRDLSTV